MDSDDLDFLPLLADNINIKQELFEASEKASNLCDSVEEDKVTKLHGFHHFYALLCCWIIFHWTTHNLIQMTWNNSWKIFSLDSDGKINSIHCWRKFLFNFLKLLPAAFFSQFSKHLIWLH